ncbi:radical SAM family heme chaperone HemW [bacterium]|nr:radical SAM family heme chaperone HemW [bacterium]
MIKHLYIHIPFCESICSYCDFQKRVSSIQTMEKYKKKLIEEIDSIKNLSFSLETIYIGGGTPTHFPYLENILIKINESFDLSNLKEFTIESTTSSVLKYKNIYKKYNVNRISIGIESFNSDTLKYINRKEETYESIKNIMNELNSCGIYNINLDLIYSLPYETIESINKTLDYLLNLHPTHISYYDLIIEDKTKLSYDIKMNKVELISEDLSIKFYNLIRNRLEKNGYHRYEISNYSLKGYESIHNLSYWNLDEYIGIGLSSHSQINNKRYMNTNILKDYLDCDNFDDIKEYYDFDKEKEYFLLGLRKRSGISIKKYKDEYKIDPIIKFNLKKHIENGLLELKKDNLRFTEKGLILGNIVFEEFV